MKAPTGKQFVGFEERVEINYVNPPRVKDAKERRRGVKQTGMALVRWWATHILPRHFAEGAEQKYRYLPRTRYTKTRKTKTRGHRKPIYYRGAVYRTITRPGTQKVGGSSKRAWIKMLGPWYLGYRAKRKDGSLGPDLKAELTRTTDGEMQEMARVFVDTLKRWTKQQRKTERKRIG